MKKCPFCAEEIQDEAIKCRYCGSDLTVEPPHPATDPMVAPPAAPTPPEPSSGEPRVGEGAIAFSHSGYRFVLGWGNDYFGIWDREAPGAPVATFPRTDPGWSEAWNRFIAWEPRNVEVPRGGTPAPDGRAATGTFRPFETLERWVTGLLALCGLLSLITFGFRARLTVLLQRVADGGVVDPATGQATDDAVQTTLALVGVSLLATALVWLIWQYRVHANLRPLGASGLRFPPGWAVGWWFIPLANVVMPYVVMREAWMASEPSAGAVEWKMSKAPALLWVWWGTFVLSFYGLPTAAAVIDVGAEPEAAATLARMEMVLLARDVMVAVSATAAIRLVRRLGRRQQEKQERLAAWTGQFTPVS